MPSFLESYNETLRYYVQPAKFKLKCKIIALLRSDKARRVEGTQGRTTKAESSAVLDLPFHR
jgi:hypothetical protein